MWILICCLFLCATACDRSGHKLEESDPVNPIINRQVKGVQGHLLAGNPDAILHSAKLDAADAASILKGFHYQASATYVYKRGQQTLKLSETVRLDQTPEGPYHLVVNNSQNKGYEVIWTQNNLYQRTRFRPFRITSQDVIDARRWQERGFGRWRAIVGLFGGRILLAHIGDEKCLGRKCYRYQIALSKTASKQMPQTEGTAWSGAVPEQTRGNAAALPRIPTAATGDIWIDSQTGLPLKIDFRGTYNIGEDQAQTTAQIELKASFNSPKLTAVAVPKQIVTVTREQEPLDPFARKRPAFLLPPPVDKQKKDAP
jgi:hypothetical protein